MARPGVLRDMSSAISGGRLWDESIVSVCFIGLGCSQFRRSRCLLLGRPGLPGEGARVRLFFEVEEEDSSVTGVIDMVGDLGPCCAARRGRTRRWSPGDAGLARTRVVARAGVEDDELTWVSACAERGTLSGARSALAC